MLTGWKNTEWRLNKTEIEENKQIINEITENGTIFSNVHRVADFTNIKKIYIIIVAFAVF